MQEPAAAEEALMSLINQSPNSNEQRGYVADAAYLLSQLYIRVSQIDRAKSECERALQIRRKLLRKRSNASFESTALMAHIYALLDNRPRTKSYLAMIPEGSRETVLRSVEESLGTKVESLDSLSLTTSSIAEGSNSPVKRVQNTLSSFSSPFHTDTKYHEAMCAITSQSPDYHIRQSHQYIPSDQAHLRNRQSVVTFLSSTGKKTDSRIAEKIEYMKLTPQNQRLSILWR